MTSPTGTATEDWNEEWGVKALNLLVEQGGVRADQVGRLVGLREASVEAVLSWLRARRYVQCEQLVAGEREWVWVRNAGLERCGAVRGSNLRPRISTLRHRYLINEVRAHLQDLAPSGHWVPERELKGVWGSGPRSLCPDGIFEVGGERHAIEVEISAKTVGRVKRIVAANCRRYDAVVYFCSPPVRRLMDQVAAELGEPKLVVRDLPVDPEKWEWNRCSRGWGRRPSPAEVPILRLVSEQGAIPLDQLRAFTGLSEEALDAAVAGLVEGGLAILEAGLAGEARWVWLTNSGAGHCGTGLPALEPSLGALARMRAVNGLRLQLARSATDARWVSGRYLARGSVGGRSAPRAVVEIGGERHAIDLVISRICEPDALLRRLRRWDETYDATVCFCASSRRGRLEELVGSRSWRNLHLRSLSGDDVWAPVLGEYTPTPAEVDVVRLVGEHTVLSVAQVGELLGLDFSLARERIEVLERGGLLGRGVLESIGEEAVWATFRGNRLAGLRRGPTEVGEPRPRTARECVALAAGRLAVMESRPAAEWIGRRGLLEESDRREGRLPRAVVRDGATELAIELVGTGSNGRRFGERVRRWLGRYGGVVVVAREQDVASLRRQVAAMGLQEVEVVGVKWAGGGPRRGS